MLQLGLLRVVTWPGSRFWKNIFFRLKIIWCPPPSWCSPVLSSVDLTWAFIAQEGFASSKRKLKLLMNQSRGFIWTCQSLTPHSSSLPSHDLVLVWQLYFIHFPFSIIHFLFSFPLLLPKSFFLLYFIYFFDLASLFFRSLFFLEQVVWSLHCLWFAGSDCDCLSLWWMKDYHLVSSSADLLVCERYPLGYRPPLMHTTDGRGITIMVLTFLNLRKDNHYCILRCALLFEFWTLGQINWTLPYPWLKCEGFSLNKKETPTSKAQRGWRGSISLISPVFGYLKQCLYILNRALFKSIQPEIFAFSIHHPPSKNLNKKLVL